MNIQAEAKNMERLQSPSNQCWLIIVATLMTKGTVLICKWEDTTLSSLLAKFVYGHLFMVRISGGASWPSLISGFGMWPKVWSTRCPYPKNTFCCDLIMKFHIRTLFSISQHECHARLLLLLLGWDRSRRPRLHLPWGAADMERCPAAALCIWIFIYSFGGRRVGGSFRFSSGHLAPLFPNKHKAIFSRTGSYLYLHCSRTRRWR